jgi:predicted lipoprotein with Yx(FWY)xxD motif
MFASQPSVLARARSRAIPLKVALSLAATLLAAGSLSAALALASSDATVGASSNATLGRTVVVNAQGHTLYTLSGESSHHLLCTSKECFKFWPPLTVSSAHAKLKAGGGVHGKLGILRRPGGVLQVTLRGLPLYRFFDDKARGQAKGEGIESFGGTWHALAAGAGSSPSKAAMPTPTPTPSPMPGYTY